MAQRKLCRQTAWKWSFLVLLCGFWRGWRIRLGRRLLLNDDTQAPLRFVLHHFPFAFLRRRQIQCVLLQALGLPRSHPPRPATDPPAPDSDTAAPPTPAIPDTHSTHPAGTACRAQETVASVLSPTDWTPLAARQWLRGRSATAPDTHLERPSLSTQRGWLPPPADRVFGRYSPSCSAAFESPIPAGSQPAIAQKPPSPSAQKGTVTVVPIPQ